MSNLALHHNSQFHCRQPNGCVFLVSTPAFSKTYNFVRHGINHSYDSSNSCDIFPNVFCRDKIIIPDTNVKHDKEWEPVILRFLFVIMMKMWKFSAGWGEIGFMFSYLGGSSLLQLESIFADQLQLFHSLAADFYRREPVRLLDIIFLFHPSLQHSSVLRTENCIRIPHILWYNIFFRG